MTPIVSVIVACRNVARYVDAAILSARRQSVPEIEILVVDDRSTDDTKARAGLHAEADSRVILLDGPAKGPGAARNVALEQARGDWIAILDADDFMHPCRLEKLLAEATQRGLDIVADNLFEFYDPPQLGTPSLLVGLDEWPGPRSIDLATYMRRNILLSGDRPLGYLKPVIRREFLARAGVLYDASLRIAEDYDLLARLLAAGATFGFVPDSWYFYRRHDQSTSYRTQPEDVRAMLVAAERFHASLPAGASAERAASRNYRDSLHRALHFTLARRHIDAGRWGLALLSLAERPGSMALMARAVRDSLRRRVKDKLTAERPDQPAPRPRALLLWAGDPDTAAPLTAILKAEDIPHILITIGEISPRLCLKIAGAAPFDLIFCDEEASLALVPYAVSPEADVKLWRGDQIKRLSPARARLADESWGASQQT